MGMSETICGIISGCLGFSLKLSGTVCECLVLSGAVLDSFGLTGTFCATLWECLGLSGALTGCLGLSGTLLDSLEVSVRLSALCECLGLSATLLDSLWDCWCMSYEQSVSEILFTAYTVSGPLEGFLWDSLGLSGAA